MGGFKLFTKGSIILILMLIITITFASASSLPYSRSGTINENGDAYWDDNEFDVISFSIPANTLFEVELETSSSAELYIFFGDINDEDDIENAIADIINYGDSDLIIGSDVTVNGYASFDFESSSTTNENIVIFSYNADNPSSMSYTLYTSVDSGSSGGGFITFIIIAAIIIGGVLIYNNSKKKKTRFNQYQQNMYQTQNQYQNNYQQNYEQQQSSNQYQPQSYNQYQPQGQTGYTEPQEEPTQKFPGDMKFCANCGVKNESDNKFCNDCGTRFD